ncbi:hypothetical protein H6504_03445 [Candidatus Woesearchaeota archaeon]|nr:hypothetical protein [Candidatus Woesearchaeota archaeon]
MKGQITLFMILGVVILFFAGVVMFLTSNTSDVQSQQNINQIGTIYYETNAIKNFVDSCLEETTKEAVFLAGMQGGYLFQHQIDKGFPYFGPINAPFSGMYGANGLPYYYDDPSGGKVFFVPYHVRPMNILAPYPVPYKYPIKPGGVPNMYYFGEKHCPNPPFCATGGYSNLLPLCAAFGSNRKDFSGANFSCDTYSPGVDVIQLYLQHYILNSTIACLNDAEALKGDKFNITYANVSNASVSVLFSSEAVHTIMDMPLEIVLPGEDRVERRIETYYVEVPVRFKPIYDLAYHLLDHETRDIYNNLYQDIMLMQDCKEYRDNESRRTEVINCFRDGMNITFIPDGCQYTNESYGIPLCDSPPGVYASFIVISDNKSIAIDNRPFQFILAIGNRPPVQERINLSMYVPGDPYYNYLNTSYDIFGGLKDTVPATIYNRTITPIVDEAYDVVVDYGEKVYLLPRGLDPDEDYHDPLSGFVMLNEYHYLSAWRTLPINEWENSPEFLIGIPPFNLPRKDAAVMTDHTDVGAHVVTIEVRDKAGNVALEDVLIQVRCYDALNHLTDYTLPPPMVDSNNTNDCCDEAGGYIWNGIGTYCATCHRCDGLAGCVPNDAMGNASNDCGNCSGCSGGACVADDARVGGCVGGGLNCCDGNCINATVLPLLSSDFIDLRFYNGVGLFSYLTYYDCWGPPACFHAADDKVIPLYPGLHGNFTNTTLPAGAACLTKLGAPYPNPGVCDGYGSCI